MARGEGRVAVESSPEAARAAGRSIDRVAPRPPPPRLPTQRPPRTRRAAAAASRRCSAGRCRVGDFMVGRLGPLMRPPRQLPILVMERRLLACTRFALHLAIATCDFKTPTCDLQLFASKTKPETPLRLRILLSIESYSPLTFNSRHTIVKGFRAFVVAKRRKSRSRKLRSHNR